MNLDRRNLFCLLFFCLVACQAGTPNVTPTRDPASAHVTHGPIAGGVTDTTANIWVRTDRPARVQIEYSTDPWLNPSRTTDAQTTDAESDFTTIVQIPNLSPQQTYDYTVLVDGVPQLKSPYPQFRTFAPPGTDTPFRFVILTDFRTISKINQSVNTFQHAAAEKPAFVILGGDLDHRNPTTLDEKREMFRDLYTPANGMEDFVNLILSKFSLIHFWDDHDFGDNNADKNYPQKATSLRVLKEYFPLYPVSGYGDWQKFTYGNADFFILDSRSQRDPHLKGTAVENSMLDGDNLGDAGQRQWLLDNLLHSKAKWKFIVSPVIFNPTTKVNDGWAAYPQERQLLLRYISVNQIPNVIFLSGDLHAGAIDDGTHSGLPELVAPTANDGFDKRCLTEGTGNLGKWSIGTYGDASGAPCNGYAVVTVNPDNVLLEVKDSDGNTKITHTVPAR